jgi:hypothetical protein
MRTVSIGLAMLRLRCCRKDAPNDRSPPDEGGLARCSREQGRRDITEWVDAAVLRVIATS